jgi:DNA-binding CsgD family transcriptional regulator
MQKISNIKGDLKNSSMSNTSSLNTDNGNSQDYPAVKGAIVSVKKYFYANLVKKGIGVSDLISGLIWTPVLSSSAQSQDLPVFGTDAPVSEQPEETAPYFVSLASQDASLLTKREREVAELIADGLTNKEIGNILHLSHYTVKSHVHNILGKMEFHTRLQIAKYTYTNKEYNKEYIDVSESVNVTS